MAAKRAREVIHDFGIKPDDHPPIVAALKIELPDTLEGFLMMIPGGELQGFIDKIMMEKNAPRVVNSFCNKVKEFMAIEDWDKNEGLGKKENVWDSFPKVCGDSFPKVCGDSFPGVGGD